MVRRARGAEWRRAVALPGRTIEHRTAEVRVHPPVPLDAWPRDLARLQVSGTELTDTAEPGPAVPPTLWANPALAMSAGKAMAQAGHAAQLAWWASDAAERAAWRAAGLAVSVRTAAGGGLRGEGRGGAAGGAGRRVHRDRAGFVHVRRRGSLALREGHSILTT